MKYLSFLVLLLGIGGTPVTAQSLPETFVYLRHVDPTIQQDMRYAGPVNFIGRRIDGYEAGQCLLTRPAALALKTVQARLRRQGLSLKVYDCYRPVRAVRHFVRWARDPADQRMRTVFYAGIAKEKLLKGYISSRSKHSRGSTVDLTMVPMGSLQPILTGAVVAGSRCAGKISERIPDNSVDMGTGYDCFDEKSHTASRHVSAEARHNRALLVRLMSEAGFRNYRREWWHFELRHEPAGVTYFDVPVTHPPE